eukprot:jgi/Chlat1/3982/Chrsp26S04044
MAITKPPPANITTTTTAPSTSSPIPSPSSASPKGSPESHGSPSHAYSPDSSSSHVLGGLGLSPGSGGGAGHGWAEEGLRSVSRAAALEALEETSESGGGSAEGTVRWREKFIALYSALEDAVSTDKRLQNHAKAQAVRVAETRARLAATSPDYATLVEGLRDDADYAQSQAAMARQREQLLELEIEELKRNKGEAMDLVDAAERESAALLVPQVRAARKEASDAGATAAEDATRASALRKELEALEERAAEVKRETENLISEKLAAESALTRLAQGPDKVAKQVEVLATGLRTLRLQEARALERLRDLEADGGAQGTRFKEINDEHSKLAALMERSRAAAEAKERAADEVRRDLDAAGLEADQLMADRVSVDMQVSSVTVEVRAAKEELARRIKDKDLALKRLKRADAAFKALQSSVPMLASVKEQASAQLASLEAERARQAASLEEARVEAGAQRQVLAREEGLGKEAAEAVRKSATAVADLEREVVSLARAEAAARRRVSELDSARLRAAREAGHKAAQQREALEAVRVKDLVILDLKKKKRETASRLAATHALYNLVKNQRSNFVNLIQQSSQTLSEMKEKLKAVSSEADILREELAAKEKQLAKVRLEAGGLVADRDHLRLEVNASAIVIRDRRTAVEEQLAEIDKLNGGVDVAERSMVALRKEYEGAAERRNLTGLTLIDRHDELCILYQRAHANDDALHNGTVALAHIDDQSRLLRIQIEHLKRSIINAQAQQPIIPECQKSIGNLRSELEATASRVEDVSNTLEDPATRPKWRNLEGKIPERDELLAKINSLEERLNDKKEQLLEKELILEEVTALAERLQEQAAEGREDTLELAATVKSYQSKIYTVTQRMMATVAELSMYQAMAMKLAQDKAALEAQVEDAGVRLADGQAPTDDADSEWDRMQRAAAMAAAAQAVVASRKALIESGMAPARKTAAETRPNAYMSVDLGIPKPYGVLAPFKPTEAGSSMRHIRKPQPREIVI